MKTKRTNIKRTVVLAALILAGSGLHFLGQDVVLARGWIESVDRTNMTVTVKETGRKELLTLYIASRTRLFKDGQPAITSDLVVGDKIHGSAQKNAEGKIEVVRLYAEARSKEK